MIASHEADFVESLATRAVVVTGGRVTGERSSGRPATPPLGRSGTARRAVGESSTEGMRAPVRPARS